MAFVVGFLLARWGLGPLDGPGWVWWERLSDAAGPATLVVAMAIWVGELHQDWTASLPKRLTVRFLHGGRTVMSCEDAYLAGEADIRQWGQQIGRQMNGNENLAFSPFLRQPPPVVRKTRDDRLSRCYLVEFELEHLPSRLPRIAKGESLVWREGDTPGFVTETWVLHPPGPSRPTNRDVAP